MNIWMLEVCNRRQMAVSSCFRHKKSHPEIALNVVLVEAAGIEPASASTPPLALHA